MLAAPWEIRLLGGFAVQQNGRLITRFMSQKARLLLAYLALYSLDSHPRERLIELLWPESDLDAGRLSLRVALASLRRQLEPPGVPRGSILISEHGNLRLNPEAIATDVGRFEAALGESARAGPGAGRVTSLMAAVECYGGELLTGFYEDWVLDERGRLSSRYLVALDALVAALERNGDYHQALGFSLRAVSADPLREVGYHAALRLYARVGRAGEALALYARMERLLREELDTAPGPESRRLARALSLRRAAPTSPHGAAPAPAGQFVAPGVSRQTPRSAAQVRTAPVPALPVPLTRFFGREAELDRLVTLLRSPAGPRLLTLSGPGGSGKTRLAIEAVRALEVRQGEDPVACAWFVPLADAREVAHVPGAILRGLDLRNPEGAEPERDLLNSLRRIGSERPTLLVLDNFEHVVDGGAEVVRSLLAAVPRLKCLVTSRRLLELPGEQHFPVDPLPVPGSRVDGRVSGSGTRPEDGCGGQWASGRHPHAHAPTLPCIPTPTQLMECPSVQLFVDRAQEVRPDFQLTASNAGAVAELCRCLEGIPLAVELAASWARALTPAELLARLSGANGDPGAGRRLDLLVSRRRGVEERHRAFRATLAWSCSLLPPELRRFFYRLSVFRGGWTAEPAQEVCMKGWEAPAAAGPGRVDEKERLHSSTPPHVHTSTRSPTALEYLAELQAHSLITGEGDGQETRFRMLETLGEYAAAELPVEERDRLARRHAEFFAAYAEAPASTPPAAERFGELARLEKERENLRLALAHFLTGAVERGLQLALSIGDLWLARGPWSEGLDWLQRYLAVDHSFEPGLRARALMLAGRLAWKVSAYDQARIFLQEAGEIFRRLGDAEALANTFDNLADVSSSVGEVDEAGRLFSRSLHIQRETGNRRGLAHSLSNLGGLAVVQGQTQQAVALFEESLALRRALGDRRGTAYVLSHLGYIGIWGGELRAARSCLRESLLLRRALDDRDGVALSLLALGHLAESLGNFRRAMVLYERCLAEYEDLGGGRARSDALHRLAHIALHRGQMSHARALCEEGLSSNLGAGDRRRRAQCLATLARIAFADGDDDRARALFDESLGHFTAVNCCRGRAQALQWLGQLGMRAGRLSAARACHCASLSLREEAGYRRDLPFSLLGLGDLALADGNPAAAGERYRDGLQLVLQIGIRWGAPLLLEGLVRTAIAAGAPSGAAELYAAANALRSAMGIPRWPRQQAELDSVMDGVRDAFDDAVRAVQMLPGRVSSWRATVRQALAAAA